VGRERGLRSAVLAGDERAWKLWYDESFDALTVYVTWRCAGLRDLTEDVVQETWLTAVPPHSFVRSRAWQFRRLAARHCRQYPAQLFSRRKSAGRPHPFAQRATDVGPIR
jgi:hypothetical protein